MPVRIALLLGTLLALLAAGAPASAGAASVTSVTMHSDSGDYIGGGQQRLYHPGNAQIKASSDEGGVSVSVSGGDSGDSFNLVFAAPSGTRLEPGVYDGAQRLSFREAGRPGLSVSGDGRGCNRIEGRFEVRDLVRGPSGAIERLWLVYEQHCEGGAAALFGEVRLGAPAPDGPLVAAPAHVRWPESPPGRAGTVVPVTMIASGAGRITRVSVAGTHPGDFPIRLDECSNRDLAAGSSCQVFVRYAPAEPGTRDAVLRLETSSGPREVLLQGWSPGGRTRLLMQSPPGEYIGGGRNYDYTPANASLAVGGSRSIAAFGVTGTDGNDFDGDFQPGDGDIIAPGRYPGATRYPFNGPEPGMSISGPGRGCNELSGEFTVTEATFEPDGTIRSFGVDFQQSCDGGPVLRGTFEYRVGDTTPRAPWMGGSPTPTPIAPEGDGGGGGGAGGPGMAPLPPLTVGPGAPGAGVKPLPAVARTGPCARSRYSRRRMVLGTNLAEQISGARVAERIFAGAGKDRIAAGAGSDCVDGGSGNDVISGGGGADVILGGSGADVIVGGPGRDRIDCGTGRDTVRPGRGDRIRRCERVLRR